MKLKEIMMVMLGFSTGNIWVNIVRYAFERSIGSGILAIISGVLYIIANGYFISDYISKE